MQVKIKTDKFEFKAELNESETAKLFMNHSQLKLKDLDGVGKFIFQPQFM